MCVPDKTITGLGTVSNQTGYISPYPTQTYTPPTINPTQNLKLQSGFQDVIAPQLGLPGAPPLFAPRIERAQGTGTQYTTDANGVKKPVQTGFQSLQINRQ